MWLYFQSGPKDVEYINSVSTVSVQDCLAGAGPGGR